jgi:hypothetical protein
MTGGTGAASGEDGYDQTAALSWTQKAYQMLKSGDLHAKAFSADGVVSSHVWGACPRCGHDLDDRQTLTAAVTGLSRGGRQALKGLLKGRARNAGRNTITETIPVDVGCGCGRAHAGAPEAVIGCGVSFRVELTLGLGSP